MKRKRIEFKTVSNRNIQWLDFRDINFDCDKISLMYDLISSHSGDINNDLSPFDSKVNHSKMTSAIYSNQVKLPNSVLSLFYNYHITCNCLEK